MLRFELGFTVYKENAQNSTIISSPKSPDLETTMSEGRIESENDQTEERDNPCLGLKSVF